MLLLLLLLLLLHRIALECNSDVGRE